MHSRRPRVLIVDDEPLNVEAMQRCLASRAETVCASSGAEALKVLLSQKVDVVVTDLRMPGMSGLDLLSQCRKTHPLVGRILVSGYTDATALVTAINEGEIFRFVAKPFSAEQLAGVVTDFLKTVRLAGESDLVLVADDNPQIRSILEEVLRSSGFQVITAADGPQAVKVFEEKALGVALVDFQMPGLSGLEVVAQGRLAAPDVPSIIVSGQAEHQLALHCMTAGAFDFMMKPIGHQELLFRVKRALSEHRHRAELRLLKAAGPASNSLIAESQAMRTVLAKIRAIAVCEDAVLITGETGSGKDAVAREIHRLSSRSGSTFLAVNCGALPESLLESELFGHEKGAFTGAVSRRIGMFEMADRGTLFLDEVGEMSLQTQAKLLRVLEEQRFNRLGGEQPVQVDVRLVAATNRDLEEMVQAKTFRQDLFYRLFVLPLHLPPLRERPEDIDALVRFAVARRDSGRDISISATALAEAARYPWPGNVRELFNRVARAAALCTNNRIETLDLPVEAARSTGSSEAALTVQLDRPLKEFIAELASAAERAYLRAVLIATAGNVSEAAKRAGMDRKSIYNKMRLYGLDKEEFKGLPQETASPKAAAPAIAQRIITP